MSAQGRCNPARVLVCEQCQWYFSPNAVEFDNLLQALEKRIRERGVRVEQRLLLLKLLARSDADAALHAQQDALLTRIRNAVRALSKDFG